MRVTLALALLLSLLGIEPAQAATPLLVRFVDVGEGDAAIYRGPCGDIGVIDIPDGKAGIVASWLDSFPDDDVVRWVAASHYDSDHIGGIDDFLAVRDVDHVYDRGGDRTAKDSDAYRSYFDVVTSVPGVRQPVDIGGTFTLCTGDEEVTFTVISAGTDGTAVGGVTVTDEKDLGLCLKVEFGPFDMATCGDVGGGSGGQADVESPAAAVIGDVDFVKVNHHGSSTSSNQTWVDTLNPAGVVISVGPNSFGHPSSPVVDRWSAGGANVYRTDLDGTVTLNVDRFSSEFTVVKTGGPDFLPYDDPPTPPPPPPGPRSIEPACAIDGGFEDGFADIPSTNQHEPAVDCIVYWQVAAGLRPGVYQPTGTVTRDQMASFLARLFERSGGSFPASTFDHFDDDDGNPHESDINKVAEVGIAIGRSLRTFGPREVVTRAQMASFLYRAIHYRLPGGLIIDDTPNYFTDDDGDYHEGTIERMAFIGVTGGLGGTTYGPALAVRRDQMGSFLARALAELVDRGVTDIPEPPPKCALDPTIERTDAGCQPCPSDSSIPASSPSCQPPPPPPPPSPASDPTHTASTATAMESPASTRDWMPRATPGSR